MAVFQLCQEIIPLNHLLEQPKPERGEAKLVRAVFNDGYNALFCANFHNYVFK